MILPSDVPIEEHRPLAPLTTLGLGGAARWFARVTSETQLVAAFAWARDCGLRVFVLGGGSNLVVADSGFDGLVIQPALRGITRSFEGDLCLFRAEAGEPWDAFVSETIAADCAGIECLAGIPGTVGGTPVQNVGAYGQEVAETIHRVRVLDRASLQFHEMAADDCGFAYRSSLFNSTARDQFVVTAVEYALVPGGAPALRYADLARVFAGQPQPPALAAVVEAVCAIRRSKGMLLVPGDPDAQSAGSFFRNPTLSAEDFSALGMRLGGEPPSYPAPDGRVKLPAAWLIEQAGFGRGYRLGNVGISSRHTLALVNCGGTAAELLALRDRIVAAVMDRFGIRLEMEPVLLGF